MNQIKYQREFCCSNCGLIWFSETEIANATVCPECGSSNQKDGGIYACDSMGYVYAYVGIVEKLKEEGKTIHYDKKHPLYKSKG